jgi:RNA polymerase sigma-70 factor (ECF subfamily)
MANLGLHRSAIIWAQARANWPDIALEPSEFFRFVAARAPAGVAIDTLPLGDLYLACACLASAANACEAFDRVYLRGTRRTLARYDLPEPVIEDIHQNLHERLIVRGQLDAYRGTGALQKWLNIVAAREALHWLRANRRTQVLADPLVDIYPMTERSPEAMYLQATYHDALREAFAHALGQISRGDRSMLRQRFVFGMTLAEIARLAGVHESTASRNLARLQDNLMTRTRARLLGRLRISSSDLDSILRTLSNRFDVGLTSLLRAAG